MEPTTTKLRPFQVRLVTVASRIPTYREQRGSPDCAGSSIFLNGGTPHANNLTHGNHGPARPPSRSPRPGTAGRYQGRGHRRLAGHATAAPRFDGGASGVPAARS